MATSAPKIKIPGVDISPAMIQRAIDGQAEIIRKKVHIGGFGYYGMLMICIAKDLLDVLWDILIAMGLGISVSIVGAIAGLPIVLMAYATKLFCSLLMFIGTLMFFSAHDSVPGVSFVGKQLSKRFARRVIIAVVSLILDGAVPVISALPITTIGFVLGVMIENRIRKGGVIGHATEMVVQEIYRAKHPKRIRVGSLLEG